MNGTMTKETKCLSSPVERRKVVRAYLSPTMVRFLWFLLPTVGVLLPGFPSIVVQSCIQVPIGFSSTLLVIIPSFKHFLSCVLDFSVIVQS